VNTTYDVIDLQQGTAEWHAWRSHGIGGSDAPSIMGENPWKNATQLLLEKLGTGHKQVTNAAMARGTALEPEARKHYETVRNIRVAPACLQSTAHEWLRASVDGLAADGSVVVEIKCGESAYRKTAGSRQAPDYYVGQLQHILAVTGLPHIDFFCWLPTLPGIHLRIERDDRYISRLLVSEQAFWQLIRQGREQ
jgi:putative phage-type endonuclease